MVQILQSTQEIGDLLFELTLHNIMTSDLDPNLATGMTGNCRTQNIQRKQTLAPAVT